MSKYVFAVLLALSVLWGTGTAGAGQAEGRIGPHGDMRVRVLVGGLPYVDNLAVGEGGVMYATLEAPAPDGKVVKIMRTERGIRVDVLLSGLRYPDGLLLADGYLYITEEAQNGRVVKLEAATGRAVVLATLSRPEGLARWPDGSLIVSEDLSGGRVVRIAADGTITELSTGLDRPEGVAVDGTGGIFVAETGSGRILKIANGETTVAFSGLTEPDQVEIGPYGAVWATEDADPGRLMKGFLGKLYPVLTGLSYPQGIAFSRAHGPCGPKIYIAEQGKGRILEAENRCGPQDEAEELSPERPAAP